MVQTEKEIKEYEEMNKKKKRNLIFLIVLFLALMAGYQCQK